MPAADIKQINIVYRDAPKLLRVNPSVTFTEFCNDIKAMHNISKEATIILFDPDTNCFIRPLLTSGLWDMQERKYSDLSYSYTWSI